MSFLIPLGVGVQSLMMTGLVISVWMRNKQTYIYIYNMKKKTITKTLSKHYCFGTFSNISTKNQICQNKCFQLGGCHIVH